MTRGHNRRTADLHDRPATAESHDRPATADLHDRAGAGREAGARACPRRAGGRHVAIVLAATTAFACDTREPVRASLSVAGTLTGGDTAGFARATRPPELRFPADHGPHPDYRHEWWYFTGNLTAEDGRELGFQLTLFRSGLRAEPPSIDSDWATSQAWMGHFAVTDVAGKAFHAFERFDRGALGLAGAERDPPRAWVGDWEVRVEPAGTAPGRERWRIRARDGGIGLELRLEPRKEPVLQGDRGLSRKGPEPGNASHYYSLTRLAAEGTVRLGGSELAVRGSAWLDREWGTSALGADLAGWDWFALQLEDGSEVMLYRLRRRDGGTDPFSAGSYVRPDGSVLRLGARDFALESTGTWTSPGRVRYPSGWRIRVPPASLDLRVEPRLRDQELALTFRYWEGSVAVRGDAAGRPVRGLGYVELTGYDEATSGSATRAGRAAAPAPSARLPNRRSTP